MREPTQESLAEFKADVGHAIVHFTSMNADKSESSVTCLVIGSLIQAAWCVAEAYGLAPTDFAKAAAIQSQASRAAANVNQPGM